MFLTLYDQTTRILREEDHLIKQNPTEDCPSASLLESKDQRDSFMVRVLAWSTKHPVWAIIFASLLAVVVNCHPIIFCGKSYVSPGCLDSLVYGWWPPLPEMKPDLERVPFHQSDLAAMMVWSVPAGFIESRSLLQYGEIPLWNRYGHAGDTLIGQAVSMLGDPLQFIVILGHGSAGAWDIKFLAAKFLFCIGFGLLILRLLRSVPLSLIFAALAAYCGAFYFINNHPVFFVFCYAPWILLSALSMLELRSRWHLCWGLVWLLANFACFNAGHVEPAVVLIGGLNLAAVAGALFVHRRAAGQSRLLGRIAAGTLLFMGLTAPMWLSFLTALDGSYSAHSEVRISQLPLKSLPGAFDDLFYLLQIKTSDVAAPAPGTSLLVLAGCIFSILRWRQLWEEPFFWVNSGAIILWGGIIFGWVPASFLEPIPLLNRIGHVYTDFSFLLVIHLTIQGAYGFKSLASEKNFRRTAFDFLWMGLVFAGMMLVYCLTTSHRGIRWNYFLCAGAGAIGAPLLFAFLNDRHRRVTLIGWSGIVLLGFAPIFRFGLYSSGNEDLLMLPGTRATLNAPSPAIAKVKADQTGPFRVVGLNGNLYGDYAAVYELEDIRSCAPLSNGEFLNVLRNFPGLNFNSSWAFTVMNPVQAQPLLNLLNVKYLLAQPEIGFQNGPGFQLVDSSDFRVLENQDAWPRAFFTDKVVSISSNEEFIRYLLENGKQPFVAMAGEEIAKRLELPRLEETKQAVVIAATNYQLLPNSTSFDIHATVAGMVCLTEGQAKDFTAEANGKSQSVLTVNRAFKGVYLDQPGDYHLKFTYRPRHWRLACTLFWISAGGATALAAMQIIRRRKDAKLGNLTNKNES